MINAAYNANTAGQPADPLNRTYAWGYGSGHEGGAHMLLGDGAVKFLSENMDQINFWRLTYMHDGAVIGEF
jgi:hypothetical protein